MPSDIIVNCGVLETRAAILEDGRLVEIHCERNVARRLVGNIYLGKVANVLPGMQSAFVDIGLERNAFLYVDDVCPLESESLDRAGNVSISRLLTAGQEVLVQIVKEPIGTKGARVTTNITLPGRYLVLMPTVDYVAVSRRIESDDERNRLKDLALSLDRKGMGIIVRTAAEGMTVEELQSDLDFLLGVWAKIRAKSQKASAPALMHGDYDLVYRLIRDCVGENVSRLVIDRADEYRRAVELVSSVMPWFRDRIEYYSGKDPVFQHYGIEAQLSKALRRKVWLDCGGYIVIDPTEALVSIDVNTGKFTGTVDFADTVFKTNMEAAAEIARQLRLRNLGGIIVIDFIDMEKAEDREKVLARLKEELTRDRTKTNVLGFTGLGLVELTRKKVSQSLDDLLTKVCPACEGKGRVPSEITVACDAERQIAAAARASEGRSLLVEAHPSVAALLIGVGGQNLERMERDLGVRLYIKGRQEMSIDQVNVSAINDESETAHLAAPVSPGQQLVVSVESRHVANEHDGIARVNGYVLDVEGAGDMVGSVVRVEVTKVFRTYARAVLSVK